MRIALIGAGSRGYLYSKYAYEMLGCDIVAVAEPDDERREIAMHSFSVPESMCFTDGLDLIDASPQIDSLIIASQDRDHYAQTMAALDKGWDILLEKPISNCIKECIEISKKAKANACAVTVCHVMRYMPFYVKLKEILDSKVVGDVLAINHTENIGNYHMAHSFVRGNWNNSKKSSPIILAKSCHDMDILLWLTGSGAKSISSFGNLSYFSAQHAPKGSANRCLDCAVAKHCRFDARKAYLPVRGHWPATVLTPDQSEEGLMRAFREGPYGRCVFKCDNDVCDQQSTIIEFDNGVTATFMLTGFTNRIRRTIHIMCEDGEIHGNDDIGEITITPFSSNSIETYGQQVIRIGAVLGGHGGGDVGLMEDYVANIKKAGAKKSRTSLSKSVESHLMASAAEKSRIAGKTIYLKEYKKRFSI